MTVHVLVIPRGLYDVPRVPNQGVFESHQVAALGAAGIQVGVLSGGVITTRHLGRRFPYLREEVAHQVPVYRAYRRAYLPARWENPVDAADRTYRRLKPLLKAYLTRHGRPDIIHAHNLASAGLVAERILGDEGIPYVVTEHTGTYVSDLPQLERDRSVLMPVLDGASAVLAVGESLARSLRLVAGEDNSRKVQVVPNVVDRRTLSAPIRAETDNYTIVGLGYLLPGKNYALLVEAFARAELPPLARLRLGGGGPESRRLARLARSLGVGDRVDLVGQLSRDQVVELLRGGDLFAHPSNSESFGVVLIEAMAMGVPVLATASSGPQDIVTPDVGMLTPVGDVHAFADGLTAMYVRRHEFERERIREACGVRYGPTAFAARMMAIYQEAIS